MVPLCQVHADHDGGQLLAQLVDPDIAKPNAPRGARWQWTMNAPPRLWVWFNLWRVLCVNLWQQIHLVIFPVSFFKAFDCSSKTLCILFSASDCVANLPMSFLFCFPTPVHNQLGRGGAIRLEMGPYSGALSTSSHFYRYTLAAHMPNETPPPNPRHPPQPPPHPAYAPPSYRQKVVFDCGRSKRDVLRKKKRLERFCQPRPQTACAFRSKPETNCQTVNGSNRSSSR